MNRIQLDGKEFDVSRYAVMHSKRISWTLDTVKRLGARTLVEVGSHPWVMTAAISDDPDLKLLATISAEESVLWPDDIEPHRKTHVLSTSRGIRASIRSFSFNVERRRFDIGERPDAVLACEIIEHLVRAPHVMLLNINDWLDVGGYLIVTTPNGCQLMNPFATSPRMPAYRAHCYERHTYLYSLERLVDLVDACGFSVVESGLSSPYPSFGTQRFRKMIASLPIGYLSEKFDRMIYVVARKSASVENLSRTPRALEPSSSWEFVDGPGVSS